MEAKVETLMKHGLCFRCMKKEKHRSRECTANHMRCSKCQRTNHYEVVCGMPAYMGKRKSDEEAAKNASKGTTDRVEASSYNPAVSEKTKGRDTA